MTPEDFEPRMDEHGHGLILGPETEIIVGCAFEVLNELGHGLLEKPYENALVVEFGLRAVPCEQQRRYHVLYKTVKVERIRPRPNRVRLRGDGCEGHRTHHRP